MGEKFKAYIQLMRLPNIITAIADILLGFAASGAWLEGQGVPVWSSMPWSVLGALILATVGLYGGGVVFNDFFDYELDKVERPERPLPRGAVSLAEVAILGASLLAIGIYAAFTVSQTSGLIAICIAILALGYDAFGKNHPIIGPLNMGACRGANLLLGVSAMEYQLLDLWGLALIPVVYISAITMVSRGEVNGGNRGALHAAIVLYCIVFASIPALAYWVDFQIYAAIPFLLLFIYFTLPPLFKARKTLLAMDVRKAVKAGVISLIVMDASIAAGFAGWPYGLIVLCLLPISMGLSKLIAVT